MLRLRGASVRSLRWRAGPGPDDRRLADERINSGGRWRIGNGHAAGWSGAAAAMVPEIEVVLLGAQHVTQASASADASCVL